MIVILNKNTGGFMNYEWRKWRNSNGWSQIEVARRAGISIGCFRNIELGGNQPSKSTLEKLKLVFAQEIENEKVS